MVDIEKLKGIHIDFINWLKSTTNIPNVESYIKYVADKLQLYDKFLENSDIRPLQNLPRVLNRYRDEYDFDSESIKEAYTYFEKMREVLEKEL